jgi:hypothetical protein
MRRKLLMNEPKQIAFLEDVDDIGSKSDALEKAA